MGQKMTDQEKREQRVNLHIDIEDAAQELAHLRESAFRIADDLEGAARRMRENAESTPGEADFSPEQELANRLTPRHQTAMDFDRASRVIEKMRQARQRIYQLNQRRSQLSSAAGLVSVPSD